MSAPSPGARGRAAPVSHILRPVLLLTAYLLVLAVVLPDGVNRRFVHASVVLSAALGSFLALGLVSGGHRRIPSAPAAGNLIERPYWTDLWLILLPGAPIVQYVILNQGILSWQESVAVVAITAALAGVVVILIPHLLRRWMSPVAAKMLGLALTFTLYSMPMLSRTYSWHRAGDAVLQLAVLATVFAVGFTLYRRDRAGAYAVIALYFLATVVVLPLAQAGMSAGWGTAPQASKDDDLMVKRLATLRSLDAGDAKVHPLPDIYLLTYDAYVEDETMRGYGIDNTAQEEFLEALGFHIDRGTYSIASDSIATMGRLLGGDNPETGIAGHGPLLDGLRRSGYQIQAAFMHDGFFRASPPGYDSYFPRVTSVGLDVLQGILEGEFRYDLAFDDPPHVEFVAAKRSLLGSSTKDPRFVYTHSGPGHSQNSGACLPDEVHRFEERLEEANAEMRTDLEIILQAHPDAVVIVNGDHGPYLTKNCTWLPPRSFDVSEITRLDIQDRFGTFLAVRWPYAEPLPPIDILQDVLPAVLSELFSGLDYGTLRFPQRLALEHRAVIAGLDIDHGRIVGGPMDGQPLFLDR